MPSTIATRQDMDTTMRRMTPAQRSKLTMLIEAGAVHVDREAGRIAFRRDPDVVSVRLVRIER